jgi:putative ABC transport system substrate-binding protein
LSAKEIVEQRPDGIVAASTVVVAALARESRPIPMVCVHIADPIGSGCGASLAHPGGTITGVLSNEPTLGSKWPEWLKAIAPGIGRMGFLCNPDVAPSADAFWQPAAPAAHALGVALIPTRVHNAAEIERAITALGSEPGSGRIVLPDVPTNARSALIVGWTARYHVRALYGLRFHAIGGGLLSYGVDGAEVFREATRRGRGTGKRGQPGMFPASPASTGNAHCESRGRGTPDER